MRHSSWTLFLIPLTLPLLILCLPGSMRSGEETLPNAVEVQEQVHMVNLLSPEFGSSPLRLGDDATWETSEARFKD